MAEMITGITSWSQEDVQKYFLEPLFVSNNSLQYMDVMTDVSGESILLDRYSALKNVTKAHALSAFSTTGQPQSTNSKVTLTLKRLEVEHQSAAFTMFNHIKSQLLKQGIARNDISGTKIQEIVSTLLLQGIQRDFSSILWWGDEDDGAATPYNLKNGLWKIMSEQLQAGDAAAGQATVNGGNALTGLENMVAARSNDLAAQDNVIWCSRAFADDYRKQLRDVDTHVDAYAALKNGTQNLSFNGIPMIVVPEWDADIAQNGAAMANMDADIAPNLTTETKAAVLTMPGNFTIATDFKSNPVDMWYNRDEKMNRFRMTYSFGCNIKEPTMWVSNAETT
jgi:hypothetical protein